MKGFIMLTKKETTYYKMGRIFTFMMLCFCAFGVGKHIYAPIHKTIVFNSNHYKHWVRCPNCERWMASGHAIYLIFQKE